MALRIKGDVVIVRRAGESNVFENRIVSDPQVKIDGDLVHVILAADTPPVEFAAAVKAARGRLTN